MIGFAIYETELGFIRMNYENEVITYLKRIDVAPASFGAKTDLTDKVFAQLIEYFDGKRMNFHFPYQLKGTDFQKRVWQALCDIPYGETRTYKEIAAAVGNSKACRAIGMANNKNPITIAVPCHRVIGANGTLVGYAGGLPMKEFLLHIEEKNK